MYGYRAVYMVKSILGKEEKVTASLVFASPVTVGEAEELLYKLARGKNVEVKQTDCIRLVRFEK